MPADTILILGGTAEAGALAGELAAARPNLRVITSLAGRTAAPSLPVGEVRIGGFGGADGLAAYLKEEGITRLIDATHPFAAGISRNAEKAAAAAAVPRLCLVRAPWMPVAGDLWTEVDCIGAARDALPGNARPFLALGRQHLSPFARRADLAPVVRMIDPPDPPLTFRADLVLGKPSCEPAEEAALFTRLGVTHLVCRNSGGGASYAKIEAARALALPVIVIARPPAPAGPTVADLAAAIAWAAGTA
ncbi:cobalt-precorrin-6A reductase [Aurantimonas sp. MSK8Z-1]|uniref:cobalt-precorrin-6A reductase n=1 Tax=Mangrovibrevibacter kandeliae TaxID=2968473 RepID=UPI002230A47B|nr:cobalt-precorrin-6A reductase [Aurantimonas sp. MSK8Z-1]MCW4117140.1 cobalt-precorrin-6A reductase [Aurantimonas sp. MSK8Z-1]